MRVVITQPSLAKYRVPVYRELAMREGIDLNVAYAESPGITNVTPDGFKACFSPMRSVPTPIGKMLIHSAQWRYANKKHADALILSWDIHYLSLIPAIKRARRNGVRTILWGHGYSKNESPLKLRLREKVGKMADATLFYNQSTADRYIERGFDHNRVFVAPNAIDQQPIQTARQHWLQRPDELQAFKNDHSINSGPMILFVSRLDPNNRLDLLIHAVPKIKTNFPDIQVVVIGKGEEELARLKQMTRELKLENNIRFLGPIYDEHQLAPWFLTANLFCYPANIGLSILHAFGYGLPVITSDNRAAQNPEIESLRDGFNGLVYDDGNADALAQTLTRVLDNQALQQELATNAHRTAIHTYSLTAMVDGMEAAIRGKTTIKHS